MATVLRPGRPWAKNFTLRSALLAIRFTPASKRSLIPPGAWVSSRKSTAVRPSSRNASQIWRTGSVAKRYLLRVAILWCAFFFNSDVDALSSRAVEVGRVVDGDTVVLTSGEIVRLAGINTPERETDQKAAEPLADAAHDTLVETLSKGDIFLEEAPDKKDRYGRTLAYLFLEDGSSVQEVLIREGLASVVAIAPNDRYLDRFALAEDAARESGAGIWSIPYFDVAGADQIRGGFQFILDKFTALKLGPKWFRFSVRDDLDVLIRRADWEASFAYPPGVLEQSEVAVRGWISKKKSKGVLVISHPFMLERCVVETRRLCPAP